MKKTYANYAEIFCNGQHARVTLWIYPAENPSKIVAIGRCATAYIARHMLRKTIEYSGGLDLLVHQGFFLPTG